MQGWDPDYSLPGGPLPPKFALSSFIPEWEAYETPGVSIRRANRVVILATVPGRPPETVGFR